MPLDDLMDTLRLAWNLGLSWFCYTKVAAASVVTISSHEARSPITHSLNGEIAIHTYAMVESSMALKRMHWSTIHLSEICMFYSYIYMNVKPFYMIVKP